MIATYPPFLASTPAWGMVAPTRQSSSGRGTEAVGEEGGERLGSRQCQGEAAGGQLAGQRQWGGWQQVPGIRGTVGRGGKYRREQGVAGGEELCGGRDNRAQQVGGEAGPGAHRHSGGGSRADKCWERQVALSKFAGGFIDC